MITIADVYQSLTAKALAEYLTQAPLNLYKTASLQSLVTQAAPGRHLHILAVGAAADGECALSVQLCEDGYPGWIPMAGLSHLLPAPAPYRPVELGREAICDRLPAVIDFTRRAMAQPNQYLWGGTVGPNYDCSGLMQAAFASAGIQLPRDSYQQEAFSDSIALTQLEPGDLIFFGQPRTNHVALYLGDGQYIHSSGKDQGRNGIGLDSIWHLDDPISRAYGKTLRRGGRIVCSYRPSELEQPGPD
ncbi:glycoside hydrolase [filamentous cyanobacterium CCP5]|nr:glycoside hydrolase [filamentous cyanobacterium CCP5]